MVNRILFIFVLFVNTLTSIYLVTVSVV